MITGAAKGRDAHGSPTMQIVVERIGQLTSAEGLIRRRFTLAGSMARHSAGEHARRSRGRLHHGFGVSEYIRDYLLYYLSGKLPLYIWSPVEMGIEAS